MLVGGVGLRGAGKVFVVGSKPWRVCELGCQFLLGQGDLSWVTVTPKVSKKADMLCFRFPLIV